MTGPITIAASDRAGALVTLLAGSDGTGRAVPATTLYDASGTPTGTATNPLMTQPPPSLALTLVSHSVVTVASLSTSLMVANAARRLIRVQAPPTASVWLNLLGGVAGVGLIDCVVLNPGDLYESGDSNAVSYWCATAGLELTAIEGVVNTTTALGGSGNLISLGTMATQNAASVAITGGTVDAQLTSTGVVQQTITNGSLYIGQSDFRRATIWAQGVGNQVVQVSRIGSVATDVPIIQVNSVVNHTGGTATVIPTVNIGTSVTSSPVAGIWGFLSSLTTNSTTASGAQPAGYFQAVRASVPSGVGVSMEGLVVETHSLVRQPSSVDGQLVGVEIDITASGNDDISLGGVPGGRVISPWIIDKINAADGVTKVEYGISVTAGPTGGVGGAQIGRMIRPAIGFYKSVIDGRDATQISGANFIWMADNQTIALDTAGHWTLRYDSASSRVKLAFSGADKWSIDSSGNVRSAGTITGSTTP